MAGELTAALTAEEQTAVATVEAELSGLAVLQLTELKAMVALAWPELVEAEAMPTKAMLMQLKAMAVMALLQPSVTKEELPEPTVMMAVVLAELLS